MSLYFKEKLAGRSLGFRLFLEGVEVPLTGGQITESRNARTVATFSVPPAPAILHLRPRTHIACFWRENNGPWQLLFEGESAGKGFIKNAVSGQSAVVKAVSLAKQMDVGFRCYIDETAKFGTTADHTFSGKDAKQAKNAPIHGGGGGDVSSKIFEMIQKHGLGGCFPEIIKLLYTGDRTAPFFKLWEKRYGMTDRFTAIFPMLMEKFAQSKKASLIYKNNVLGSASAYTAVTTILNQIMELTWMEYSENNRISKGAKYLFKPNIYFAVPPRCNCIFPDQQNSVDFHIDDLGEITRYYLRNEASLQAKDIHSNEIVHCLSTAPADLSSNKKYIAKKFTDKHQVVTFEEMERGIIPKLVYLNSSQQTVIGSYDIGEPGDSAFNEGAQPNPTKDKSEYYHKYAQGQYYFEKFKNRNMALNLIFSPQIASSYPGAIFTDYAYILGDIAQVSHSFSAVGGTSTMISVERPRLASEYIPETPLWLKEGNGASFKPLSIGGFYDGVLGCSSLLDMGAVDGHFKKGNKKSNVKRNFDFTAFGSADLRDKKGKIIPDSRDALARAFASIATEGTLFDQYLPKDFVKEQRSKQGGEEGYAYSQLIFTMMETVYRYRYLPTDDKHKFISDYTKRLYHTEAGLFKDGMGGKWTVDPSKLKIDGSTDERPQQIWTSKKLDSFKSTMVKAYIRQLPINWGRGVAQGKSVLELDNRALAKEGRDYLVGQTFTKDRINTRENDTIQDRNISAWPKERVIKSHKKGFIEVPTPKKGTLGLHPLFEERVEKMKVIFRNITGKELILRSGFRTVTQQRMELSRKNGLKLASGRDIPNTPTGESLFQYGFAIDVFIDDEEILSNEFDYNKIPLNQKNPYTDLGQAATEAGLGWGGTLESQEINYIYELLLPSGAEIKEIYKRHFDRIKKDTGLELTVKAYESMVDELGKRADGSGFLEETLL